MAEYERTLLAERMRRGRLAKYKAGFCCRGRTSPTGFGSTPTGRAIRRSATGSGMPRVSDEPRQGIRGWVKRHPVASFFVLAYALSWLVSFPAALGYGFMFLFTQFGPALAGLVVTWTSNASVRE